MTEAQTINQLIFLIFGLIVSSLFVGTFRVGIDANGRATRGYWLLSLATRAGAFFSWALIPLLGPVSTIAANALFIFSAGCLAMMFRSWRTEMGSRPLLYLGMFCVLLGIVMEMLRESGSHFSYRMITVGAASLAMSVWELSELLRKMRSEPEPSLKLISGVVLLQMLFSSASVINSVVQVRQNIDFVTDNAPTAMVLIWLTLTIHLVIYLFIAGYLFRRALTRELAAIKERNDVTLLLEERERLLASLIASNRVASTGALSASVAHEMSQPLTAAMMKLGLLRRAIETPGSDHDQPLTLLSEAVENIGRSKDVLDHLRSLFRGTSPKLRQCSLHDLVVQTIALMQSRLDSAHIELIYLPNTDISAPIVEREIQQVLINLINNAIDSLASTDKAGKKIAIEIDEQPDSVSIAISDNGPGVQPELFDTLFELARSDKSDGMGIGLWISRFMVEDHHRGKIYIDGSHTFGARFVIELPKAAV
jgi:signal transduction histidine kinase